MDYNLAKELKNKGFPQNFRNGYFSEKGTTFREIQIANIMLYNEEYKNYKDRKLYLKKIISIPTIEELVEFYPKQNET